MVETSKNMHDSSGALELYVPAFERTFQISIQIRDGASAADERTNQTVDDIANLTAEDLRRIRQLLYSDAMRAKEEVAFGDPNPPIEQPPSDFFRRLFWSPSKHRFVPLQSDDPRHPCYFPNGYDGIDEKLEWLEFRIDETQDTHHRFALLDCRPRWEEEHGVTIVIRDGRPIGIDNFFVDLKKYDGA